MLSLNPKSRNQNIVLLQGGATQIKCARRLMRTRLQFLAFLEICCNGQCHDRPRTGQPHVTIRRHDNYIRQKD